MKHFTDIKDFMNFLRFAKCDTKVKYCRVFQEGKIVATYDPTMKMKPEVEEFDYKKTYKDNDKVKIGEDVYRFESMRFAYNCHFCDFTFQTCNKICRACETPCIMRKIKE